MTGSNRIRPLRIQASWLVVGLLVAALPALVDVADIWYSNRNPIRTSLSVLFITLWTVYASWLPIAVGIGLLLRRFPISDVMKKPLSQHFAASVGLALLHLLFVTVMIWLVLVPSRVDVPFMELFAVLVLKWSVYELIAYWVCLAAYVFYELHHERSRSPQEKPFNRNLAIRQGNELRILAVSDINWIEAYDNYVIVNSNSGVHIVNDTMARMEAALESRQFHRIHRSTIVNLRRIECLRSEQSGQSVVVLNDGTELSVSRRRRARLRSAIQDRK